MNPHVINQRFYRRGVIAKPAKAHATITAPRITMPSLGGNRSDSFPEAWKNSGMNWMAITPTPTAATNNHPVQLITVSPLVDRQVLVFDRQRQHRKARGVDRAEAPLLPLAARPTAVFGL